MPCRCSCFLLFRLLFIAFLVNFFCFLSPLVFRFCGKRMRIACINVPAHIRDNCVASLRCHYCHRRHRRRHHHHHGRMNLKRRNILSLYAHCTHTISFKLSVLIHFLFHCDPIACDIRYFVFTVMCCVVLCCGLFEKLIPYRTQNLDLMHSD